MLKKIIFGLLIATGIASAALVDVDRALIDNTKNILENPGFESGKAKWTASAGTFAANATAKGFGALGGAWNSSAAAQTLRTAQVTIPNGLKGKNAVVSCAIKTTSGSATHKLQAFDGTNVVAEGSITSSTTMFARTSVNFAAPSSGTLGVSLVSVAADEPEIYIDDCLLGLAEGFNLSQVNQAVIFGGVSTASTTNCAWSLNAGSTYTSYSADSDCNLATAFGNATAPATKIPAVVFNSLPPGEYEFQASGGFTQYYGSGTPPICNWQFSDGTTGFGSLILGQNSSASMGGPLVGRLKVTTAQSNVTIQVQVKDSNTGGGAMSCDIYNRSTTTGTAPFEILVRKFPTSSEIAYRPEINSWHIDTNIRGSGNIALGTSAVTEGMIADSTLTLGICDQSGANCTSAVNTGSDSALIACSGTNPATGVTCAAGNEQVGLVFGVPRAGKYEVCSDFNYNGDYYIGNPYPQFDLLETSPTNDATILQYGKGSRPSEGSTQGAGAHSGDFWTRGVNICQTFNFTSSGQKAIRMIRTQSSYTTGFSRNLILATGRDSIHWKITPITQSFSLPVIIGGAPTITKYLSGSGTYTPPRGARFLKVRMVGGGGGGGSAGGGSTGGTTTFGTSLLTAIGGSAGSGGVNGASGGTGGTATVAAPAVGFALTGGNGDGSGFQAGGAFDSGGGGGSSPFGGGGGGGKGDSGGLSSPDNTGGGGGGTGCLNANRCGSGGGAGGYVEAIINTPDISYAYSVGASGAGASGAGAGSSGVIIIEENY